MRVRKFTCVKATKLGRMDKRGAAEIIRGYLAKDRTIPSHTLAKNIYQDYYPRWGTISAIESHIRIIRGLMPRIRHSGLVKVFASDTTYFLPEDEKAEMKRRARELSSKDRRHNNFANINPLGLHFEDVIRRFPDVTDYQVALIAIKEKMCLAAQSFSNRSGYARRRLKERNEFPYNTK